MYPLVGEYSDVLFGVHSPYTGENLTPVQTVILFH